MRYFVRDRIMELIPTLIEAIEYVQKTELAQHDFIYDDFRSGLKSIQQSFEEAFTEETYSLYNNKIIEIETDLQKVFELKQQGNPTTKESKNIKRLLKAIETDLQEEKEVKLEILFIPYKYAMWDSLESIWEAANKDPRCNAYVMPIPYYDRDHEGRMTNFHYEGQSYVENRIPIVSYEDYNYIERRPDVIYFHNPYDEYNAVTSVAPEFYSSNLKYYTKELVYVPYFITSAYKSYEGNANRFKLPGVENASTIILQNDQQKEVFIKRGIPEYKIKVLGSPKLDFIHKLNHSKNISEKWISKIRNRKVILLNSTIGRLLREEDYMEKLRENIDEILKDKHIYLIWRPHPLLEATIKSMRPHMLEDYNRIKEQVQENGILDYNPDISESIMISDGLISDNSSIVRTYILTGKPILLLESSYNEERKKIICADILGSYFINDGVQIKEFINILVTNNDYNKLKRVERFKESIVNTSGEAGGKIHRSIFNSIR